MDPIGGGIFVEPAFGGVFTVLLGMPILGDDELRRQRDDFILLGATITGVSMR